MASRAHLLCAGSCQQRRAPGTRQHVVDPLTVLFVQPGIVDAERLQAFFLVRECKQLIGLIVPSFAPEVVGELARKAAFQAFLKLHAQVATWTPNITTLTANQAPFKRIWFEPHYVAMPRMNGLCRHIFRSASVTLGTEITRVEPGDGRYMLLAKDGSRFGPYDWIISSAPAEQAARIFSGATVAPFDDVKFDPCFALMVPLSGEDKLPAFEAAVVKDSLINWLAFTESKPGRTCAPSLVAHSDGAWARQHLEDDPDDVKQQMAEALISLTGLDPALLEAASLHRWRYARTTTPLGAPCWFDAKLRLGACGDWCLGDRVEDAFTSGQALAAALEGNL